MSTSILAASTAAAVGALPAVPSLSCIWPSIFPKPLETVDALVPIFPVSFGRADEFVLVNGPPELKRT